MMSDDALLRCEGLACGYPRRTVLTDVAFSLTRGVVTVLLGPNGSGKSTLLKTLSKTLSPLGGRVWVGGAPLEELSFPELARRVAYVPQEEHPVYPFTVREVVLMGRLPYGQGLFESEGDQQVATEAMAAADCLALADRPVTELSGGERQRALIARALAQQAPTLLLDEPTAHLDVGHQVEIVKRLRSWAAQGYGVLAAVHDLNLASALADRAVLLEDGHVGLEGPCAEVLASPRVDAVYGVAFNRLETPEGRRMFPTFV